MSGQSADRRLRSKLLNWVYDPEFQSLFSTDQKRLFSEMSSLAQTYYNRKADELIPPEPSVPPPPESSPEIPVFLLRLNHQIYDAKNKMDSLSQVGDKLSSATACLAQLDQGIGRLFSQSDDYLIRKQQIDDYVSQVEWRLEKMSGHERILRIVRTGDLEQLNSCLEDILQSIEFVQQHSHFEEAGRSLQAWFGCLDQTLKLATQKFVEMLKTVFPSGVASTKCESMSRFVQLLQSSPELCSPPLSEICERYSNFRLNQLVPSLLSPLSSLSLLLSVGQTESQLMPPLLVTCLLRKLCRFVQKTIRPLSRSSSLPEIAECLQKLRLLQHHISALLEEDISRRLDSISGDLLECVIRLTDGFCTRLRSEGVSALGEALVCLDLLFGCCESRLFSELASQVANSCIFVLNLMDSANLRSALLVIHNSLLLREKLTLLNVDTHVSQPNIDFSNLKHAVTSLFSKNFHDFLEFGSNNAILGLLTNITPDIHEHSLGVYTPLDDLIRTNCGHVYSLALELVVPELVHLTNGREEPQLMKDIAGKSFSLLNGRMESLMAEMNAVMENPTHSYILMGPIRAKIGEAFSRVATLVESGIYTTEEVQFIGFPTKSEVVEGLSGHWSTNGS